MAQAVKRMRRAMFAFVGAAALVPAAAGAQLFHYEPQIANGPIEASDPLVGLALPGATAAEYRAHMIWNLRSGLNVAALQCQFSPYLRAVDNYNDFLAHHSRELAAAYTALEGYFRRVHGRTGPRQFDDYSTQTYNNFSTLQAQLGFCQTSSQIAKAALMTRKGELHSFAASHMRTLRGSLTPVYDRFAVVAQPVTVPIVPVSLRVDCTRLPRRERRTCEREQAS